MLINNRNMGLLSAHWRSDDCDEEQMADVGVERTLY